MCGIFYAEKFNANGDDRFGENGWNMARRLRRGGVEVVGYDRSADVVAQIANEEGMLPAVSVETQSRNYRSRALFG